MKNTVQNAKKVLGLALLLTVLMLTGCKPKEDAPTLPPQGSMMPKFSDFYNAHRTTDSTATWTHASVNVLVWDVILFVNLAVPTSAFAESCKHDPKYNRKSEHWIWSYDFNWYGKYSAALHGWYEGTNVQWEMYISKEGDFQNVLWFSGTSKTDGTGGTWTLNKDGNAPITYIGMNWSRSTATSEDIAFQFTNLLVGDAGNGDYIRSGVLTNDPLRDLFYNIYDQSANNLIEIQWHHLNQNGRVKDPAHFGDTNWHCWDEMHADIVCP